MFREPHLVIVGYQKYPIRFLFDIPLLNTGVPHFIINLKKPRSFSMQKNHPLIKGVSP